MHASRVIQAVVVAFSVLDAAQAATVDGPKDMSEAVAVRADHSMSVNKGGANMLVPPTFAASNPSPSPSPSPDPTGADEAPSPTPKVPDEAPPTSEDGPSQLPSPSSPPEASPTPPAESPSSPEPAGASPGPDNSSGNSPTPAMPLPSGGSFGGGTAPPASEGLGGSNGSGGSAGSGAVPGSGAVSTPDGSRGPSSPGGTGNVVPNPNADGLGGSGTSGGGGSPAGSAGSPGSAGPAGSGGFAGAAGSPGSGSNASPSQASSMTTIWAPVIQTEVAFVTMTNSDGSTMVSATTTIATHTMPVVSPEAVKPPVKSKQTRNTIVGVVVGVGGAIVLGALGLVAFRIWGRKKHAEEADGLMDYHADLIVPEKSERGSSAGGEAPPRNPFQSTLDNYHQPVPVNASSNF